MQIKRSVLALFFGLLAWCPLLTFAQSANEDLIAAAKKGDLAAVRSALSKGADVNARTNYGATALHFAADRGHLEVVKALVEAGADVNAKDDFYKVTPTMMAMMRQRKDVMAYLQQVIAAKKDAAPPASLTSTPSATTSSTAPKTADPALNEELLTAAKKGDLATVKSLLAKGADVNAKTRYNQTPLMFAAQQGHLETVKTLLAAGADINARDSFYGFLTALGAAAGKGHAEIVRLLLDKGAPSKEAALMAALNENRVNVVKLVLELGGLNPETLTAALGSAIEEDQKEIIALLKQAGATPPPPKSEQPVVKISDETLKKYAGLYRHKDGREFTFFFKDGKLQGWDSRQYSFTLVPVDQTSFRLGGSLLTFTIENEKVTGLSVKQGAVTQTYSRVEGK